MMSFEKTRSSRKRLGHDVCSGKMMMLTDDAINDDVIKLFVNSSNLQERSWLSKAVQKDFNLLNNKVNQNQSSLTPFANQNLIN